MPRYYFSIANGRTFDDVDGLELADEAAARLEARGFAGDLMRMEPDRRDWSGWSIKVTGENQKPIFDLPFSEAW